jgi:heme exporter protein D
MAFDSFSAFISMGNHGPYVWASYGVFFILLLVLVSWSLQRRRVAINACRQLYESQGAGRLTDSGETARAQATFTRVNVSND